MMASLTEQISEISAESLVQEIEEFEQQWPQIWQNYTAAFNRRKLYEALLKARPDVNDLLVTRRKEAVN